MNKLFTPKAFISYLFIVFLAVIYFISYNFFDYRVNDIFTNIQVSIFNKKSSDDVVVIAIDDKSLSKISWPWKRDLYSKIFDFLEFDSNAKSIVFSNLVLFPDTYHPQSDSSFYKNLNKHDKLINSYILFNSAFSGDVLPPMYKSIFDLKKKINIVDERSENNKFSYKGIVRLPKEFLENAKNLGYSHIPEDKDEIVRNYNIVVPLEDNLYPSIALAAYSMYSGINSYTLNDDFLISNDENSSLKIPIKIKKGKDYIGNTVYGILSYLKWYNPNSELYSHKVYSAIDIIESYNQLRAGETPVLSPELFKDKIIVFGLNADKNIWNQLSETPVLKRQADIDVHATMISNLLTNDFLTIKKNDYTLFLTIVFCIFIVLGFRRLRYNLLFTMALSTLYFIYYIVEYFSNSYVPPITPILTMFVCALLKKLYVVITTDKTSEMMKLAMGKYVSKDVMKKIVSNLDKLKLGGVRTEVTILFVDIRNFTQISESLNPSDVTSILNEYFSTIEPIIAKYNGVINKYMGDGVLAVFGEPIKTENHSLNAIYCGIEILEKVKILREKLLSENKPKIEIGIGVNTGEVFVGNIGTEERLEYTIIGDNVNLAYRIESYNQILKTQFLISEFTYEYVKDVVDVVKLTHVEIKGKSKPIDIYEVLKIKKNNG